MPTRSRLASSIRRAASTSSIGPVVAQPVAVAVAAGGALGERVALVVALPVLRLGEHSALDDLDQVRPGRPRDELDLDHRQGEQRLAHREGQGGTDLEDGPVVFDELAQLLRPLVVGRVRLEDQVVLGVEDAAQLGGRAARR